MAAQASAAQTWEMVRLTGSILGQFVTGQRSIKDMGGPVKIAKQSGEMAALGIGTLIFFTAFISTNLGFINLLPLPMPEIGRASWRVRVCQSVSNSGVAVALNKNNRT